MTERLVLRPWAEGDIDFLESLYSDATVARYLYHGPRSGEVIRELLATKIAGAAIHNEGDWLGAAAVVAGSDEVVADISLCWASALHKQGEIGFAVPPKHQGKGYATEAARPLIEYGFTTIGLHRIIGRAEARNTASVRVLERLGMRREAHLIENEWVKGEWQSEVVCALLARDWEGGATGQ